MKMLIQRNDFTPLRLYSNLISSTDFPHFTYPQTLTTVPIVPCSYYSYNIL